MRAGRLRRSGAGITLGVALGMLAPSAETPPCTTGADGAPPSVSACVASGTAPDWRVSLVDVARQAGLLEPTVYGGLERKRFIIETNGAGVAFVDVDADGRLDVFLVNGTRLEDGTRRDRRWPEDEAPVSRLYLGRPDGTFRDVTKQSGLARTGWGSGVCVGDYDGDALVDLFVTYFGDNVLYRNRGGGRFEDVTTKAGLPSGGRRWGSGCTFVDYDRDGRLDLFVANYLAFDLERAQEPGQGVNCLWKGVPVNCGPKGLPTDTNLLFRNQGDGTFRDVSVPSGIAQVTGRYPMTAAATDFDGDGWTDLYVASDSTAAILYRNNHDGTFTDVAVPSGVAFNDQGMAQAGMGLALGDVDADGILDLAKTHFADDVPALYRGLGKGLYEDLAMGVGLGVVNRYVQWGAGLADLDNDGWQDFVYVTGNVYPEVERVLEQYPHRSPRIVFRNVAGRRFEDVTSRSGPGAVAAHSSRGAAFGDYDNDGDIDILVMNMNEPPSLLRNDQATRHHWLQVALEGADGNTSAVGAIVRVMAAGRTQARAILSQTSYYSHDDLRAHFGLGTAGTVERIEVQWPSGRVERFAAAKVDRAVVLREGTGSTLPAPGGPQQPHP